MKRLYLLIAILIALLLAFIWGNSLMTASESSQISGNFSKFLGRILPFLKELLEKPNFLRKAAHFVEFSLLGFLLHISSWRWKGPQVWLCALALGVLAACIDEGIQLLIPGRGPSLWDVALDSAGVLTGTGLAWVVGICLQQKNGNHLREG